MPYIHHSAVIIGDVTLGRDASVWPTAVLRGDSDAIVIGNETNVQDGTIIHVDPGVPVYIGAVIGTGSVIGAGALVPEAMIVPPGSLVLGVPGKVVRAVDEELRKMIEHGATSYVERGRAMETRGG